MAEIDDLFRGFQAGLGPLPAESRRRILAQVTEGRRSRAASRRSGRLVAVVASLAGIAAVTTAAVVVRHLDDSAVVPADAPRVNWGQVATVRVVPDAGVSMRVAMDRVTATIRHRAALDDIPGIRVERDGSDALHVTVPGSVGPFGLRSLTSISPITVYDRTAGRSASYTTRAELKRGLPTLTPSHGYLLMPSTTSDPTNAQWVPSRTEADRRLRSLNGPGTEGPRWEAIATPAGHIRLIASTNPDRLDVIADEPLLTGAGIERVRAVDANTLVASVSASTRERLRTASRHGDLVAVFTVTGPYATVLGRLTVPSEGTPRIVIAAPAGTAADWASSLAPAPVPAQLTLTGTRQYGTQPMTDGEPLNTLPEPIDRMRRAQLDLMAETPTPLRMPIDDVRRVLTTVHDGHKVSVYAARTPDGNDAVYGDLGIGEGNLCTPAAGPPSLTSCPFNFSTMTPGIFLGRIGDPAITSVTVQARSGSYTAAVENGWYLAFIDETDVTPRTAGNVRVTGMNTTGDVIATLDLPAGRTTRASSVSTEGGSASPSDLGERQP